MLFYDVKKGDGLDQRIFACFLFTKIMIYLLFLKRIYKTSIRFKQNVYPQKWTFYEINYNKEDGMVNKLTIRSFLRNLNVIFLTLDYYLV